MKKKRWSSLIIFLVISCFAFGQMQDFHYKRPITGITDTWHKIELPTDIFPHLKNDLSDIRIYGISSTKDTLEASYLLKVRRPKVDKVSVPIKILNQFKKKNTSYITLQIPSKKAINTIQLDFTNRNFDYRVKVEGSYDQKDWFPIAKNKRIVSIKHSSMDYAYTNLEFSESEYEYYRLSFTSKASATLEIATTSLYTKTQGKSISHSTSYRINEDKKGRVTILDIELENALPIHKLSLSVADSFDYYRRIEIEYVTDSTEINNRKVYEYRSLYNGILSSIEQHDFVFDRTMAKKIRVYIYNEDNQPLQFVNATSHTYQHELIVRFTKPASYYLVYGNQNVWKPSYDIKMFEDKIPVDLSVLTIGTEGASSELSINPVRKEPLFKNKAWLWAIMILAILLLGWFTFKMMKKVDS